jgi:hypothetical protein
MNKIYLPLLTLMDPIISEIFDRIMVMTDAIMLLEPSSMKESDRKLVRKRDKRVRRLLWLHGYTLGYADGRMFPIPISSSM